MDALDETLAELSSEALDLFTLAEGHLKEDSADDAESNAAQALVIFRELGHQNMVAEALRVMISAMQMRDDYDEAMRLALEELERFEEAEDRNGEAAMLLTLAEMNVDRRGSNSYQDVLSTALEAQAIYQEQGNKKMVAVVLLALCTIYSANSKSTGMLQAANGALTLFRDIRDRKGEGQAYHALAGASGLAMKYQEALKQSMAARKVFQELGLRRMEAMELQALAMWHQQLRDYWQMLQCAEMSLELCREADNRFKEVVALGLVVDAHSLQGDHQEALKKAQEALERYEASGFTRGKASTLQYVTNCHLAMKKHEQALESAEEALDLLRAMGDDRGEATMLCTIAEVHLDAQKPDLAMKAAQEAHDLMGEVGDTHGQAALKLHTLVNIQIANNQNENAKQTAREALRLFQASGNRQGEGAAKLQEANLCQLLGDLQECRKHAEEARLIFEDIGDMQMLARAMQQLISVEIVGQMPEEATQLAYQGHVVSQKAKDKVLEVNMLFLVVQAQFAALKKFGDEGGERPSRQFTDLWNRAEKAAMAASKLVKGMNNKELEGNSEYVLGEVNLVNGKYKEALRGADESIRLYSEIENKSGQGTALVMKGQALKCMGRLDESLGAAQAGQKLGDECGDPRLQALAKDLISSIQGAGQPTFTPQQAFMPQPEAAPAEEAEPEVSVVIEEKPKGLDQLIVTDMLHGMLREMMGMEVEADTPFMDAGVDSLMSIEFRSQVNQAFSGLSLSNTLTFDYPTLRELTGHVVEKSLE